jgi:hypothetical protein
MGGWEGISVGISSWDKGGFWFVNAFRRSDIDLRPRVFTLSNVIVKLYRYYLVGALDLDRFF